MLFYYLYQLFPLHKLNISGWEGWVKKRKVIKQTA